MIELDGSQGEGGGQILRTALALSLVTGKPFRMDNIRAKRPKPGLMRQHLACVNAAVSVGGGVGETFAANANGQPVQIGETTLLFTPGQVRAGDYEFAVGSAGSCMLVLQTVLWPLLQAKEASTLLLSGGTHNPMAPSISFLQLLAPYFGGGGEALFDIELRRHGFYPAGGGEARVRLKPPAQGFAAIDIMQRGALLEAYAECLHAGLPKGVAERELAVLQQGLAWDEGCLRNRGLRNNEGPGNALLAVLRYEHITEVFAAYGEKTVSAEQVARRLLQEVRDYQAHLAPVGPHLADQLMIPMALAAMQGRVGRYWATELTEHTRTNARTIEAFLSVKFSCEMRESGVVISVAT
ncbi:RNA 3''-phosphate cyclase [Polaromonas sp. CF318]|uniref:RNA 3'-terminal phosphate cyclase n=1 Tax=Polaromonas sp. CF318 TaxID=1144318 RepID=UPI0002712E3F|nr:RNA 3'-terminal phosphate cyclase [Polaromonas sp. CF318]EJL81500.1 RNA 3''-phosphate cyclase [Polaromonas sp. CF318]